MKNPYFSVFKRADRHYYSVAFKDKNGKYLPPISTGQLTAQAAYQTAMDWLRDGIPAKREILNVKQIELKELSKKIEAIKDAKIILDDLRRRGLVKSYILAGTKQSQNFTDFLSDFWTWEISAYIQEKLRKQNSIHKYHCQSQKSNCLKYWGPFFEGKLLGEITQTDIDRFIDHMGTLKKTKGDKKSLLSAAHRNRIIKAGIKPLRWAFSKGLIENDITRGIMLYSGDTPERHILTPELAQSVFKVQWQDEAAKLANMLAMATGMRQGEILALQVRDIGKDRIYVKHGWNYLEGLKTPKTNETRDIECPFPWIINTLLEQAGRNPWGKSLDGFVFWSAVSPEKPKPYQSLIKGLRAALVKTGMSTDSAKVYTFHGWRHYFTSYMRERINAKLLQSQMGHKTLAMLDHYSDHVLDGDRERIQAAQIETFAGVIPETGSGGANSDIW